MIQRESIQQVIERADIVEVIGQFVNLKRRGANYIARCPFHNEKTPSFNVNPAKGIFKCFGCGKGGDTVSFIEEYEKFSFVEAIRWLANYYSIELSETEAPEEVKVQKQVEESLRIINEFAARYFEDQLWKEDEGQVIGGQYFKDRGFRDATIHAFRLGYCPDQYDAFARAALENGFSAALLEKSGLIRRKGDKLFDNYRGRVVFPIFSNTGRVMGFGARILKKNDHAPKYVNTPENELYVKSKVLYGLYQARKSIAAEGECLLVEGYTDVISLHQEGVQNVVASSGTSLTEGQLKLIGSLCKHLTILYDGDAAGVKAALRGMDMALADGFTVRLVLLPEGHDPDSFMKERGSVAFKEYIQQHQQDFIEFRLETGLQKAAGDPLKKAELVREIAESISRINKAEDFTLQDYYVKKCATELQIEEEGLVSLVNTFIRARMEMDYRQEQRQAQKDRAEKPEPGEPAEEGGVQDAAVQALVSSGHEAEWQLLRILLEYGSKPYADGTVATYFRDRIDLELLEEPLARRMAAMYFSYWEEHEQLPTLSFFINHLDSAVRAKAADLLYEPAVPNQDWKIKYKIDVPFGEELYEQETTSSFAYFELKILRNLLKENMQEIQSEKDQHRLQTLMKTHLDLKQQEKGLMALVIVK